MAHVISDLSKYALVVIMAIYTLECFAVFRYKDEEDRDGIYMRQIICMFLVHFIGFAAICLETSDASYIVFYGFQQILLFAVIALFRVIYPEANRLLINNMCMLLSISFVMLTRLSYEKSMKQFKIVAFSLLLALIIPYLVQKMQFLKKLGWVYGLFGVVSLGIVLILGAVTNGSKISYTIEGVTFQPSEFIKIVFVFFVAAMLSKAKDLSQVLLTSAMAALHVVILVVSKDLGSALIFFITYVAMIFVATRNYIYLFLGIGSGVAAAMVAYQLFSHVRVRVLAFQDPFSYIDTSGYQIAQSLFAIGTGGWFGMGIYQGQPSAIPYVEADFIFSAIAEEMGVIFALCVILMCMSCFLMIMNISTKLKDSFWMLVAVGIGVIYIFQNFLTIGGGTKFIPLTGVTLPLVSYGGSSVLSTIIMFAIIEGLYVLHYKEGVWDEQDECAAE